MDYREIAAKIRLKYPQIKLGGQVVDSRTVEDSILVKRLAQKYPQFKVGGQVIKASDISFGATPPPTAPVSGAGAFMPYTPEAEPSATTAMQATPSREFDVKKVAALGAKGAAKAYVKAGEMAMKTAPLTGPAYWMAKAAEKGGRIIPGEVGEKVSEIGGKVAGIMEEPFKVAKAAYEPTPEEMAELEKGGMPAELLSELIAVVGETPLYLASGQAGAAAGNAIMGGILKKLGAKLGGKAGLLATRWLQHTINTEIGLTGYSGSQAALEEGATVGDVLKTISQTAQSVPFFTAAGALAGPLAKLGPTIGKVGKVAAGGLGMGLAGVLHAETPQKAPSAFLKGTAIGIILGTPELMKKIGPVGTKEDILKAVAEMDENLRKTAMKDMSPIQKEFVEKAIARTEKAEAEVKEVKVEAETAKAEAAIDQMTGLKNRTTIKNEILAKKPAQVAILDIDNYKNLNDTYGHEAGDIVKKKIAGIIKNIAGEDAGIVGGEEFLLTRPELAEQVRQTIEATEFEIPGGKKVKVTISGGVGEMVESETPWSKADKNLLEAKKTGKNKIVGETAPVAKPPVSPIDEKPGIAEPISAAPAGKVPTAKQPVYLHEKNRPLLEKALEEVKYGGVEPGGLIREETSFEQPAGKVIGRFPPTSYYPEWFQALFGRTKGGGASGQEVTKIIEKTLAGESLTERQGRILDKIVAELRHEKAGELARLRKEQPQWMMQKPPGDFESTTASEVIHQKGDQIFMATAKHPEGEWMFVKDIKPNREMILKDGEEIRVSPEDEIKVKGVKPAMTLTAEEGRATPQPQPKQLLIPGTKEVEFPKTALKPGEGVPEKEVAEPTIFDQPGREEQIKLLGAGISPEQMVREPQRGIEPIKSGGERKVIDDYLDKHVSMKPTEKAPTSVKQKVEKMYTAVIEQYRPIKKAVEGAKKGGIDVKPGEDPALLVDAYRGSSTFGAISKLTGYGTYRWNVEKGGPEYTGVALDKILKPFNQNFRDITALMTAQYDIELSGRGEYLNLLTNKPEYKIRGVFPEESQRIIEALRQHYGQDGLVALHKAATKLRDWEVKATLDPLVEVDAISKELYQQILKSNKYHVPFNRLFEEIEQSGVVPKSVDVFQPGKAPIYKIEGSERKILNPIEQMVRRVYTITNFVERQRTIKSIVDLRAKSPELQKEWEETDGNYQGSKFKFVSRGETKWFKCAPEFEKALEGLRPQETDLFLKMGQYFTKVVRIGATFTPEFALGTNPVRDQVTAFVNTKYGFIPIYDFMQGLSLGLKKPKAFWDLAISGGLMGEMNSLDRVPLQLKLAEVMGRKDVGKYVKNPLEAIRVLAEQTERATRLGVGRRALGAGAQPIEAAHEMLESTINFQRFGSQTKMLRLMIAFWNPNVQAVDKMVRAFKDRPATTMTRLFLGVTLPSIALHMLNRDDERYKNVPQWQKNLFWIINPGKDKPLIRLMKPPIVGQLFGSLPERLIDQISKTDPGALKGLAGDVAGQALPGYMPSILLPVVQAIANYDFFRGQHIVDANVERLPPEMQATPTTSETFKLGSKILKGKLGIAVSPAKTEAIFTTATANLGRRYILPMIDKFLIAQGVVPKPPPKPSLTAADIPVLRAFVVREPIGSQSESVNRFYDVYTKAMQSNAGFKELLDTNNIEGLRDYFKQHPEGPFLETLTEIAKQINSLRQNKELVYRSKTMTPEQKRKMITNIDSGITKLASGFMSAYYKSGGAKRKAQ